MKTARLAGAFLSVLVSGCLMWCSGCGTPEVPKPPPTPPATSKPAAPTSLPKTGSPAPGVSGSPAVSASPVTGASSKPVTSPPVAVSGGSVTVSLTDKGPDPQQISLSADKETTIHVINKGKKAYGFKFEGDFGRRVTEVPAMAPGKEGQIVMNLGPGTYSATQTAEDEAALPNRTVTFESAGSGPAAPPASPASSPKGKPANPGPAAKGSPSAPPVSPGTP